jgi:hypothetical protein
LEEGWSTEILEDVLQKRVVTEGGKTQRENWRCMAFELLPFEMFNDKSTPLL